ncbi:MAG: hypothetical protein JWM64_591 [Frankiales bacterium]|nr:hypothetical protein [Frankiales bacterium]
MGIKDLFSHGSSDADGVPSGEEPGASTTQYDDGKGTIGLADRRGDGAPDTNQGKAEPMPPTPAQGDPSGTGPHTEPPAVPDLDTMSAGMAGAQVASPTVLPTRPVVPGATFDDGGAHGGHPGTVPAEDRPHPGTSSSTGSGSGPEMPESQTTGTAHRAPGLQGETPDGESVESGTTVGAARMAPGGAPDQTPPAQSYPGDSQGVNVPHEQPMEGTSEEQSIVHGVKDPARPQG